MKTSIFYDPRQNVSGLDSFSPSAGKPARFFKVAVQHGITKQMPVTPVTRDQLLLVHSKSYVNGVFNATLNNGFENNDPRVPAACLWTIGSLLSAARHALANPLEPVCSPTSGFHHAGYDWGGGYCTFNGLMVVAATLVAENPDIKIGVLDCDFHFGDGTADILQKNKKLRERVVHHTQGDHFYGDNKEDEAMEFPIWLAESAADLNDQGCDLVLYQAGADPHIRDPLGGFLDDRQLRGRDDMVMRGIKAPIVWNLAGGYQNNPGGALDTDPVLRIHIETLLAAEASIRHREAFAK